MPRVLFVQPLICCFLAATVAVAAFAEPFVDAGPNVEKTSPAAGEGGDMNDIVYLARAWLDTFAEGNFDAFPGKIAGDFILRIPFLPPGMKTEFVGREAAREVLVDTAKRRSRLILEDVVILRTEDPELVLSRAKARATWDDGSPYRNELIMLTRIRDGVVLEHTEYLNPLAVSESMVCGEQQ